MTTTITVKAHAWPVRVTSRSVSEGNEGHNISETVEVVRARSSRDFYVHSGRDLLVHEIQPTESDYAELAEQPEPVLEKSAEAAADKIADDTKRPTRKPIFGGETL